jgi:methionyl-tRNA formyltransferase
VKVVLLCRDGPVARHLAHALAEEDLLDAIVVEAGGAARRRKLRREVRRTPWWRLPLLALDLVALALYGRLWNRELARRLRGRAAAFGYPDRVPRERFDDANEPDAVAALRRLEPDVLVVLGTSILRAPVLSIPKRAALNVHGGIVPEYRNVHSEVWAVLARDHDNVGTSILHLDEGIDSGAVALAGRVTAADGFFDLRWRNLELARSLVVDALHRLEEGALPRDPQDESRSGFHSTPGFGALVRLLFTRWS